MSAILAQRLHQTQGDIIRLKRRARRQYGPRRDRWPLALRDEWSELKRQAKEIRRNLEATAQPLPHAASIDSPRPCAQAQKSAQAAARPLSPSFTTRNCEQ